MMSLRGSVRMLRSTVLAVLALILACPVWSASIGIDIDVVPSATTTGVLSIQRVELSFDNGLPEKTVAINAKLKARAAIRYSGNGALIGYWVVDGRPLQTFNTSLTFGDSIVLETTDLPPLPTLEPGDHEVTLQLSVPAVGFTLPTIRYHVETAAAGTPLTLVQPADGAILTRPRRDNLLVSGNTVTGNTSSNTLTFSWRPPVILPGAMTLRGAAAVTTYRFAIMPANDPAHPLVDARVSDPWYALPAALATTLPTGQQLVWIVEALNVRGAVLASSDPRQVSFRAASNIELLTPTEGEGISESDPLTWRSLRSFDHYEVRGYLNSTAMLDDLKARARLTRGATSGETAVFTVSTVKSTIALPRIDKNLAEPGLALYWVVVGYDRLGKIQDISEVGSFHLTSNLASLNGLPKSLQMSGFEIVVDSYRLDTPPGVYSGSGNVHFARDRAQRDIPLDFTALNVEPYREQTRQISGTGANQKTVISETLKGRVTSGRIENTFTTPPVLDMQGYAVTLRSLTLDAGANGGAWADLTLALNGYRNGAGITPAPLALPNVTLEAGGDFFAEVSSLSGTSLTTTTPSVAGLTLSSGTLIADFSLGRDFIDSNGLPVARDAGIFLMRGSAKLDASTLFPVTTPQQIQLNFDAIELKSDGYDGIFTITESDNITPVVPADYSLYLTGGSLAIAHGTVQPSSLTLDGVVKLPANVRTGPGNIPTITFANMHRVNATLIAAVQVPYIEWGEIRGAQFRLLGVSGELRFPYGAVTDWQNAGLYLMRGTLDSPIRSQGEIGVTTPVTMASQTASTPSSSTTTSTTASSKPKGSSTITSSQNQVQSNVTASQIQAALAGNQIDLYVRTGGVSGTLKWSAAFAGKIGDFDANFNMVSFTFIDNAVTDSRLDGELVVPVPANFKLGFTEATITGTGEIVGPKLATPNEIPLDYWRVKLVIPPPQTAVNDETDGRVQLALAASATTSDAPLLLAAANGGIAAPTPNTVPLSSGGRSNTTLAPATIITKTGKTGATTTATSSGIVLSRSYLSINFPQLQFLLDPKYGPIEFDPLELQSIEIGADGQIRSSRLRLLGSHFLKMNVLANSATALTFEPYSGGQPAPNAPLVTIKESITFPRLGERHVTLAHTVSGARADHLTPNADSYGDPKLMHFDTANLIFHNAYAEGTGQFKEFLGTTQFSALETLYANGLMMIGADEQGVYERIGFGVGVDPLRAAALYSSGFISVSAKLGSGAVNLATEGKSTAATEVAKVVGSVAEVASASPEERPQKLLAVLEDSVALAKRIHEDTGGKENDEIGTSLELVKLALGTANTVVSKKTEMTDKERVTIFVELFDLAIPVIEKIEVNGNKASPEVVTALNVLHLGTSTAKLILTDADGKLSKNDWLTITEGVLAIADPLVTDAETRVPLDIIKKVIAAAKNSDKVDEVLVANLASAILAATQTVATGPDWNNVRVLAQALFDSIAQTKGIQAQDRAVKAAVQVFGAGGSDDAHYGSDADDKAVKTVFRVAKRTMEAVSINTAGIAYDAAGRMVRDAYNDALRNEFDSIVSPPVAAHPTLSALLDVWTGLRQFPLADSTTTLRTLIHDIGGDVSEMDSASYLAALDEIWVEIARARDVPSLHLAVRKLDDRISAVVTVDLGQNKVKIATLMPTVEQFVAQHYAGMVTAFRTVHTSLMGQAASISRWEDAKRLDDMLDRTGERIYWFGRIAGLPDPVMDNQVWCEKRFTDDNDASITCVSAFTQLYEARFAAPMAQELAQRVTAASTPDELLAASDVYLKVGPMFDETQRNRVGGLLHSKVLGFRDACAARVKAATETWDVIAAARECTDNLAGLASVYEGLGLPWSKNEYEDNLRETFFDTLTKNAVGIKTMLEDPANVSNLYRVAEAGIANLGAGDYTGGASRGVVVVPPDLMFFYLMMTVIGQSQAFSTLAINEMVTKRSAEAWGAGAYIYHLMGAFADFPSMTDENRAALNASRQPLLNVLNAGAAQSKGIILDSIDPRQITSVRSAYDVMLLVGAYRNLVLLPGQNTNDLKAHLGQWVRAGRDAPCSAREQMEWFWSGIESLEPSTGPTLDVERGLIEGRCKPTDPKKAAPDESDPEQAKLVFTGAELREELDGILDGSGSEADKKAALGWLIAGKIETLTHGYTSDTPEQRVLRVLNKQAAFVIANKERSPRERVAASLDLIGGSVTDFVPSHTIAARYVPKVLMGLKAFVEGSGDQQGLKKGLLVLAGGMVDAFIENKGDSKTIMGALSGLFDAIDYADSKIGTGGVVAVSVVTVGVAAGIGLAYQDEIKGVVGQVTNKKPEDIDYTNIAATIGLTGDFWQGLAKRVPAFITIGEAVPALQKFYKVANDSSKSSIERLDALKGLLDVAGKLPLVGPYARVAAHPEQSIALPDTDQQDYLSNLLLAELVTARNDNPPNRDKAFKSTCPGFSAEGGVHFNGPEDANGMFVCTIDLAREAISSHMQGAINPNSVAGQNQLAHQAVETMRREAVFAPAIGGDNLSGIAGGVEYRNGQFASFDMISTFGMQGFFESAATINYTAGPPGILTLRQASADNRDAGLLGSLHLSPPGMNQILGTDVFNNPIKQLYVQVGGPSACLDMRAALGADTPLGNWNTGEQTLRACADPIGFDLNAQLNTGFSILQSITTVHLFLLNGNGGLDLGQLVGIDTGGIIPEPVICDAQGRCNYIKWWGAYANVSLGLGITAGLTDLALNGRGALNLGAYVTEKDEPYCDGTSFEPSGFTFKDGNGKVVRYGTCRYNFGIAGDFRVGTNYNDFYFKGQAGVDMGVAKLGVWVYRLGNVTDSGAGTFPTDRYGGFVMLDSSTYLALMSEDAMP